MTTAKPTLSADRVDNDVVTNTDWNRDALQNAFYLDEVLHGNNPDKIPPAAITGQAGLWPNILVNGGFEIWQRGTGPFTTGYTADRWGIATSGGSTVTVSRAASQDTGSGSQFEVTGTYTHVAAGSVVLFQNVEDFANYRGRTVRFFARVLTSVNAAAFIRIGDGVSAGDSGLTGNNVITTLTATRTVASNAAILQFAIIFNVATCNFIIDNCYATIGPAAPTAFQARQKAEEDRRCAAYYQIVHPSVRFRSTIANEFHDQHVQFPARMGGIPTITRTAGTTGNLAGTPGVANQGFQGCRYEVQANLTNTDTFAVNEKLTLEYNP